MKKTQILLPLIVGLLTISSTQSLSQVNRSCSVVCLNDDWIPESYNKNARCQVSVGAEGIISVHETGDVSDKENYKRDEFVEFKLAIFKKSFDSMVSFSDKTYSKIDIKQVLEKCEKGDQIIVILKDAEKFSLPNYKIDVI
ncbi:MAG: hypothetical protein JXQ96_02755 [Cyclobacteriaceae bacterium]